MESLAKATIVFALLPTVLGHSMTIPDQAIAQTILPINSTTQVNVEDNDVFIIGGGTQAAGNLFHSFEQFNLTKQQTAHFVATPTTTAIIGQVIGGTASNIDGLLKVTGSNADLYLINPAGLLFGANARLDLGGSFTATTATHLGNGEQWFDILSNPDYQTLVTPPSHFGFSHPGTIINHGQLTVPHGHSIRLLATQVKNTGTLSATDGDVSLLAIDPGHTIYLRQNDGLLSLEIDADANLSNTLPSLITGGDVSHSDALIIDNHGELSLVQGPSNNIQPSFSLTNAGDIYTQGTTGGEINLLGNTIQVTDSTLNVSGNSGSGVIRIGGNYQGHRGLPRATHIDITNTTRLIADGIQSNGGQIIIWSDDTTTFDGSISAQSATGNGGLVETSGLNQLTIGENATVTTAAPQGNVGLWLLDPTELTVVETGGGGVIATDTNDAINSTINASTIVSALNNTKVTLQASDTININTAIDASGNSISSHLLLDTVTLNLNEQITLHGSGQLSGTANTVNVGINGSIQNGVDAVTDGGTVHLAATTYREGHTITLDHELTLTGQGHDSTIISGDIDNDGTGNHQVFKITSSGEHITLSDLTIQDGLSTSAGAGLANNGNHITIRNTAFFNNEIPSGSDDGGAIHNSGSLTLSNTTFENNRSNDDGGAIDIALGSVKISDSSFINNQANDHGGAIDLDSNGSLVISNTDFSENFASNTGGAIYLDGDTDLNSVTFIKNTSNRGGAIYTSGAATLNLDNSTLSNNQAQDNGGAIYIASNNSIRINQSVIEENIAENSGGGIYNNSSDNVTISKTSFSSNQALTGFGGGIHNLGTASLSNTQLEENTANQGGGIFNDTSSLLTLTDSDFHNNQAITDGGGIYNNRGEIVINNSGFYNNYASRGGGLYNSGTATLDSIAFLSNQVTRDGGGFYNQTNATSQISTGRFLNNSAQSGGALYNRGDTHLLDNIISNNQATGIGSQAGGAGIFNTDGGSLIVDTSLIANNTSTTQGGGILNLASDEQTVVAIAYSSIVGNQSSTKGGGIANASLSSVEFLAKLTVSNSTISNNQATSGGGISTVGPTTLTNVTIAENIATSFGGGIAESSSTDETLALINTIVANNKAPISPDVDGQFSDQGNNLIGIDQGSTGFNLSILVGTANSPLNPNLTALNTHIGSYPSHQLLDGSFAANAGNNSAATNRDQHGQPRIIGDIVDIGAVESNILPDPLLTLTAADLDSIDPNSIDSDSNPPTLEVVYTTLPPSTLRPFTSTSQQQTLTETLADLPVVSLNNDSIFRQEEQANAILNTEHNATTPTTANGRLHYFDEAAFQYLEDSFSKEYEQYWQLPQTQPVTLPSVQEILNQANQTYQTNTAIIYATFVPKASSSEDSLNKFILPRTTHTPSPDDQLLLLLVPATGEPVQQLVDVSRADLTQQAKLFRLAVADPEDPLSYKALARQMYGWLLGPLQQDLTEHQIDHVMYSLDQGLRSIPLAAMMQENSFAIEQYSLSLIPSMGLTQLQIGNIDAKPQPLIAGAQHFKAFADLPAVPIELNVVAQTLQSTDILLDATFTLENFLTLQTSREPNLLHLATHAEFNPGNLDASFIQFWDSPLTFAQMKNMPWSEIELLILSACNTALSSPEAALGFIGLAAAAGIETSIGSLWNVSDVGTLALMAEFYAQLPNTPLRSEVIQQAQISLLRGHTRINNSTLSTSQGTVDLPTEWTLATGDFTHPFYWAGFTMVGNPWH